MYVKTSSACRRSLLPFAPTWQMMKALRPPDDAPSGPSPMLLMRRWYRRRQQWERYEPSSRSFAFSNCFFEIAPALCSSASRASSSATFTGPTGDD